MLNRPALLVLYYFGLGFVLFLCWCIAVHRLNQGVEPDEYPRFNRLAMAVAAAGIVHPALGFAARDVARQLLKDAPSPELRPTPQRLRSIDALAAASLAVAALIVLVVT